MCKREWDDDKNAFSIAWRGTEFSILYIFNFGLMLLMFQPKNAKHRLRVRNLEKSLNPGETVSIHVFDPGL